MSHLLQSLGKVVLFAPVGLLASQQSGRRWMGLVAGLVLSSAGELARLFTPGSIPSLTDILLNTLGAFIGMTLAWPGPRPGQATRITDFSPQFVAPRCRARRRWAGTVGGAAAAMVVLAAVALTVLISVVPDIGDAEVRVHTEVAANGAKDPNLKTPSKVAAALTATEDAGFYSNPGVDPAGIIRWLTASLTASSNDAGGATLEQQLAKMLYSNGQRSSTSQVEQVGLAVKLAHGWPKAKILEMYLATAYFGHGYYGLEQAARGYFATTPARLDWPQSALLAGLVQAPSAYDPLTHPALAKSRRSHVLQRLAATGHLERTQANDYSSAPLELAQRGGQTG